MAFWITLIQTLVKMIIMIAISVGAIFCGKKLRDRKDAKNAAQAAKTEE